MKQPEFMNNITRTFGKIGLSIKKHSPEILIVGGIVGGVASAVLACRATVKAAPVLDELKSNLEKLEHVEAHPEELTFQYTKEDAKKDRAIVKTQAVLKVAKLYGPSVLLGGLSIVSILSGNKILRTRNAALAAAYTAVDTSFKGYRNRVIERFGEEMDKELKYNLKTVEVEETTTDKNGKEVKAKKTIQVTDGNPNDYSPYAKCYDVGCNGWERDAEHNLWFLQIQQNWANEKLKAQGYLFLNDVYEALGIQKTKAGQVVGWTYKKDGNNEHGDNYVDFGIFNIHKPSNRDFVNGYEKSIWLDFNVDGNILDLI